MEGRGVRLRTQGLAKLVEDMRVIKAPFPVGVKLRKPHSEQMLSALPPIATGVATLRICAMSRHRRAIRLLRRLALASSPVRPIRLLLPPLG